MIPRLRRFARNGGLSVEAHSLSTTRKALMPSSTTYARHKIMQINLNPTRREEPVVMLSIVPGDPRRLSLDFIGPSLALRVGM